MNQAYRLEQPPHNPGKAPDVQDGQSTNPYPETGFVQVVDYPEYRNSGVIDQAEAQDGQSSVAYGYTNIVDYSGYRNIGPISQASSSCSDTEPVYAEPATTEPIYTEPETA